MKRLLVKFALVSVAVLMIAGAAGALKKHNEAQRLNAEVLEGIEALNALETVSVDEVEAMISQKNSYQQSQTASDIDSETDADAGGQ